MMSLPARGAWIEMWQTAASFRRRKSLPARGAWIEIHPNRQRPRHRFRRSPRGERGLKSAYIINGYIPRKRRSPRGERGLKYLLRHRLLSTPFRRSPRGERGLKYPSTHPSRQQQCRSPRGERGLKCFPDRLCDTEYLSLPARGAWIEISGGKKTWKHHTVAPREGSVD